MPIYSSLAGAWCAVPLLLTLADCKREAQTVVFLGASPLYLTFERERDPC
jgi:hypothetical protein